MMMSKIGQSLKLFRRSTSAIRKQPTRLFSSGRTAGSGGATTTAVPPRAEYPKSFVQHAKSQTSSAFKVGITFLTFSLSVQLVNAKTAEREARKEMETLYRRIFLLEKTLVDKGLELPNTFKLTTTEE